jgi:hypothetical protein
MRKAGVAQLRGQACNLCRRASISRVRDTLIVTKGPGMLPENMSTRDRDIRLALVGPLAVLSLFFLHGIWMVVVGAIGLIFLATSATGFCPLYYLLGKRTPSRAAAEKAH